MDDMLFYTCSVRWSISRKLMHANKKMFFILAKLHMYGASLSIACARDMHMYVYVMFVRVSDLAGTLPVINNANGFRQQCQGIMHKHGCVNKIQKNCSISRLRIAYLPERRGCRSLIIYTFSPTSDSTSLKAKQCVRTNQ